MPWRTVLIDIPARLVDRAARWYVALVAAVTLLCFINVFLWLLAYLVGLPLP